MEDGEGRRARAQGKVLLATVKGDVHDIGKNIVGVVLGCNNYEVIDLGVMVPAETILDTAERGGRRRRRALRADHAVARPDGRRRARDGAPRRLELPLLIGGATTSRQHTAVQDRARVRERDGARARREPRRRRRLAACSTRRAAPALDGENRELQERLREQHAEKVRRPLLPLEAARANRAQRRASTTCPSRRSPARATVEPELAELVPYIDWQFFFHAWDLKGKFPAILEQPGGARALRRRAGACSTRSCATARCRRAASTASGRRTPRATTSSSASTRFCFLRQQADHGDGRPNRCLADYVAPAGDHVGAFAVGDPRRGRARRRATRPSTTTTARSSSRRSPTGSPRRSPSGCTSSARREWYAPDEQLPGDDLLARALPRHPAGVRLPGLPRSQREGASSSTCSAPRRPGIELTESFAMMPAAAVSGIYLAHPQARYFAVGRIGRDQLEDYAARKGEPLERGRALARAEPLGSDRRSLRPSAILSARRRPLGAATRLCGRR